MDGMSSLALDEPKFMRKLQLQFLKKGDKRDEPVIYFRVLKKKKSDFNSVIKKQRCIHYNIMEA